MYSLATIKECAIKFNIRRKEPDKNNAGTIKFLCFLKFNVTANIELIIANIIIEVSAQGDFINERNATNGIVARIIGNIKQCTKQVIESIIPALSNFSEKFNLFIIFNFIRISMNFIRETMLFYMVYIIYAISFVYF